jgi:glycosyltransferase involved in cell wall biosynthesis
MAAITAIVHTKNSAQTLRSCLESLRFVEQVLVVDMASSDNTKEVAKSFKNVTWHEYKDVGYVEPARNFALQQVNTPWTLIIDADEEVPEQLRKKLLELSESKSAADVYRIPRKNIIFNKWVEHTGWWPDYQLRFFKTGAVQWPTEIHAQPKVQGREEELPVHSEQAIIHHNYQTIDQFIDRLNRYTSIEVKHGRKQLDKKSALPLIFSEEFCRRYFAEQGFKDGTHGLALSYLQTMYQVTVFLKHWEVEQFSEKCDQRSLIDQLQESLGDMQYWVADYHVHHSSGITKIWWQIRRKLRI